MNLEQSDTGSITSSIDLNSDELWTNCIDPSLLGTPGSSSASENAPYYEASCTSRDEDVFADLTDYQHSPTKIPMFPPYSPASEPAQYLDVPPGTPASGVPRAQSQPPAGGVTFMRSNGVPISAGTGSRHPFPPALREPRRGRQHGERGHPYRQAGARKASTKRFSRSERLESPMTVAHLTAGLSTDRAETGGLAGCGDQWAQPVMANWQGNQELLRALDVFLEQATNFRNALLLNSETSGRRH